MADEKDVEVDPTTLYCSNATCDFEAKRGEVLKGCPSCGGKHFVNNVQKLDIKKKYATANEESEVA